MLNFFGFPSSSQWVPWHVLNSSSLYPISFALSSILVTYVTQRRRVQHFYFGTVQSLVYFYFVVGQWKMPITKEKIELWVGSTIQFSHMYFFALVETGKDILKIWFSYFPKNHIIRESPCHLVPKKKDLKTIIGHLLNASLRREQQTCPQWIRTTYTVTGAWSSPCRPLPSEVAPTQLAVNGRVANRVSGSLLGPPCSYRGQGLSRISFVAVPSRVTFNNSMPRGGSWIVSDGYHHCFYGAACSLVGHAAHDGFMERDHKGSKCFFNYRESKSSK